VCSSNFCIHAELRKHHYARSMDVYFILMIDK